MKRVGVGMSCAKSCAMSCVTACAITLSCVGSAWAGPSVLASPTDLLASAPEALFESFEGVAADNRANQQEALVLDGVTVMASAKKMAVYNRKSAGQASVTGKQYVKYSRESNGSSVTFDFDQPVDIFGLSIIDWGERGKGALSLWTPDGEAVQRWVTPQPDAAVKFMGVELDAPVPWLRLSHDLSSESWAFDDLYFGLAASTVTSEIEGEPRGEGEGEFSASAKLSERAETATLPEPMGLSLLGFACLVLARREAARQGRLVLEADADVVGVGVSEEPQSC